MRPDFNYQWRVVPKLLIDAGQQVL